jgi:hypothetical protein
VDRATLTPNPEKCLPIPDDDMMRLRATYGSSLWSNPETQCKTCDKRGWFRFRRESGEIIEVECDCTEQWLLHLWLLNAGIGLAYQRLGMRDVVAVPKSVQEKFADYLDKDHIAANLHLGRGLMLWSPDRGTGKSLLATLALKSVMELGYDGYFTTFPDLIDTYTATWRDQDQKRWFDRRVRNAGFLVIDDIGREYRNAEMTESMIDGVIRARAAAARPTIVTTNLKPEDLQSGYGHNVLSLLSGSLAYVEVRGTDYRKTYESSLADDVRDGVSRPVRSL